MTGGKLVSCEFKVVGGAGRRKWILSRKSTHQKSQMQGTDGRTEGQGESREWESFLDCDQSNGGSWR